MKTSLFLLIGLLLSSVALGQSIKLGPINTRPCEGDTVDIPYHASGAFSPDNIFKLRVWDSGAIAFNFLGSNTAMDGTFRVMANGLSDLTRMAVMSSNPFLISDTTPKITVLKHSGPALWAWRSASHNYFGNSEVGPGFNSSDMEAKNFYSPSAGLTDDTLVFAPPPFDYLFNPSPSIYTMEFPWDVESISATDTTHTVVFHFPGYKKVSISVTNSFTCGGSTSWSFYIPSRHPVIPQNARVITANMGIVTGTAADTEVWLKSGASFIPEISATNARFYVEPGAVLQVYQQYVSSGIIYLREGASYGDFKAPGVVVIGRGIDTFQVPNLTFDYSKVSNNGVDQQTSLQSTIRQASGHLYATSTDQPIELRLLNLLGSEVLSRRGTGELDVDLSSLAAGIYIVVAESNGQRVTKKIAVVS